jgi:hypothetical protein
LNYVVWYTNVAFLKITIEGRAIYGNLENKINTLYWPVENSIPTNNDKFDLDAVRNKDIL